MLDATVAGPNSNSYVDVAYADGYFVDHWNTAKSEAWSLLTTPQKERVLVSACRLIETIRVLDKPYTTGRLPLALVGTDMRDVEIHRQLVDQRLQFPRNVDIDPSTGAPTTPDAVREGQCEQAVYLIAFDEAQLASQMQGIAKEEFAGGGGVRVWTEFSGSRGRMFAPMTIELMEPYIRRAMRMNRS